MEWLQVIIDIPPELDATSTAFWSEVLGWPAGEPWRDQPSFRSFEPPSGSPYVHRQLGDHGPRVHLDLEVANVEAESERLRELGAAVGPRLPDWQVMSSPGGLPFCLLKRGDLRRPGPVGWNGHRSRLVQVCIDSPSDRHDAEVDFWRAATAGRWVPGGSPEFTGKLYPEAGPVQLLLQRLGPDSSESTTTAHIDLGTDDIDAEVERVAALGAERLWPGEGWYTLRDPAGMTFCVTGNAPD